MNGKLNGERARPGRSFSRPRGKPRAFNCELCDRPFENRKTHSFAILPGVGLKGRSKPFILKRAFKNDHKDTKTERVKAPTKTQIQENRRDAMNAEMTNRSLVSAPVASLRLSSASPNLARNARFSGIALQALQPRRKPPRPNRGLRRIRGKQITRREAASDFRVFRVFRGFSSFSRSLRPTCWC